VSSEHSAEVIGFSRAGDVLVRLGDGRALELSLVDEIRDRFEVGSRALIYFDADGTVVGWYLPDAGIGMDLRNRRPP
jgi:DNA-binding transcriptional regulator LsrR (DeoR family)